MTTEALHIPNINKRTDGTWGVICLACSEAVSEYVYPCQLGRWPEVPPARLVDADTLDKVRTLAEQYPDGHVASPALLILLRKAP